MDCRLCDERSVSIAGYGLNMFRFLNGETMAHCINVKWLFGSDL